MRQGHELRLVIPAVAAPEPAPVARDEKLVALLPEVYTVRKLVSDSPRQSINRIVIDAGRCRMRLARLFGVARLAPSIVTTIIEERQPHGLIVRHLLDAALPPDRAEQREMLGSHPIAGSPSRPAGDRALQAGSDWPRQSIL